MIKKSNVFIPATTWILLCSTCMGWQSHTKEDMFEHFFRKKSVTIAVMDSGLGGLSIMADAVERMREAKVFSEVRFVFFNALFSNEGGYNGLRSRKEKIRVFNSALQGLEKQYRPDLILIGCNTLSALYNDTAFSRQAQIPVKGIIDAGVELIAQHLRASPVAKVLLFATQTTISEKIYEDELAQRGFLRERIVSEACPDLVPYIEKGPHSDETEMLIYAYVDEALQKSGNLGSALYVSFNCTHYGYSLELWKKAFRSLGTEPLGYLNPNFKMNDFLFTVQKSSRFPETHISADVVSMVPIDKERIDSIGNWIKELSPQTAAALKNYSYKENLFEWKTFVTGNR
ncbi:MAG: aspartate/glutamate racemase family protein [Candidatus Aminicenantes bacterium]|nr:aspartate/glutamate racemase family protein [Candidatus Aminicenantes bacterium]